MPESLDVPFADVCADTLRWSLGLPERQALASKSVRLPGGMVATLRLLGASHQVLIRAANEVRCSETVACDLPEAVALPQQVASTTYRFSSTIERCTTTRFRSRVEALIGDMHGRSDVVVGRFPGDPYAVTALALERNTTDSGISWRSWHAYPQTGELVTTYTRVDGAEVIV